MSPRTPGINVGGGKFKPILRSEIEQAQEHTNSNAAAARWLGVSYQRYKKYATLYGIFERHLNPTGVGVEKGWAKKPGNIPLRDILAGKHPRYSLAKLKNRLLARKKLQPVCDECNFSEARITDGKYPMMISFKDGDHTNFNLSNLKLLCYNCMFLTTGAPTVVNRNAIEGSFTHPERVPKKYNVDTTTADYYDPNDTDPRIEDANITLSDEEKQELMGS